MVNAGGQGTECEANIRENTDMVRSGLTKARALWRPLELSKEAGSKQALWLCTLHPEMQWMFLPSINLCRTEKDVDSVLRKKVHICVNIYGYCLESLRSSNEYFLYEHSHSKIDETSSPAFSHCSQ